MLPLREIFRNVCRNVVRAAFRKAFGTDATGRELWARQVYHWSIEGMRGDHYTDDPRVRIGAHTYGIRLGMFQLVQPEDRVTIGKYCSIATGVEFIFGEHRTDHVSTFPLRTMLKPSTSNNVDAISRGPIVVGNDVWIGTDAKIMSGVEIGDGAVIGAGAVVTRNVPDYAIVTGVPAALRRYRFHPETIGRLKTLRWWDWPQQKIVDELDAFYGNVDDFIDRHGLQAVPNVEN